MSKTTKLIIFLILAVGAVAMILFFPVKGYGQSSLLVPAEQAQGNINTVKLIAIVYFVVFLANGVIFLVQQYYFELTNNFTKKRGFMPKFFQKLGNIRLQGLVEDNKLKPVSHAIATLYNADFTVISSTNTNSKGMFKFFVKVGEYLVSIEKFGMKFDATNVISIRDNNESVLEFKGKYIEDIALNPKILRSITINKWLWFILVLFGLMSSWFFVPYLGQVSASLLALCAIFATLAYFHQSHTYLVIFSKNNQHIARTQFNIKNQKGEIIARATSNKKGAIKIIASSGIYKISSKNTKDRTFSIPAREIVDLELKV